MARPTPGEPGTLHPKELLAAIAESTTFAIFVKDRDGRYRLVNRHLAELWSHPASEILGKTDFDLLPENLARQLRATDEEVMTSRRPMTVEQQAHFGDGVQVFLTSKVPLVNEEDEVYGVCGIAADITDLKSVEKALRESEARFRTMADAAPVLIWMSGPDKEGVFFNHSWLSFTGRELEEELGEGWLEGVHPDDQAALQVCVDAFEERRPFTAQFRLRRWDGRYRWILDTGVPRRDPDGAFAGFIGSCVDITDQIRLQQALRAQAEALAETHRRKDEFLAMLGHELRNPMAPLRNVIELFQSRRDDLDDDLRTALDIADRQLNHMKRLVDDLLDVARITRGRVEIDRKPVALRRAVEAALETVRPLFDRRGLEVETDLPDGGPLVLGDETRLAQIVGNLLHNAAKYTPEGGRVTVRLEPGDQSAAIEVTDTGIGIAPERLDEVFELFQQREQTLERSEGGLGLGLALVRELVEMHEGRVSAASEGEGEGSTFRIELPTLEGESDPEEPRASTHARDAQPCRILVVDDSIDAADSLATLLELDGHDTVRAYDGKKALDEVARFEPDVVLLDIGLPQLDGYEVARRIRASDAPQPILVALTGYGQESAREKTRELGFDHHLLKPVDFPTLRTILSEVPRCAPD